MQNYIQKFSCPDCGKEYEVSVTDMTDTQPKAIEISRCLECLRAYNRQLISNKQIIERQCADRGHRHGKFDMSLSYLVFVQDGGYYICQRCQSKVFYLSPEDKEAWERDREILRLVFTVDESPVPVIEENLYNLSDEDIAAIRQANMSPEQIEKFISGELSLEAAMEANFPTPIPWDELLFKKRDR